jgi:hypothetical protein
VLDAIRRDHSRDGWGTFVNGQLITPCFHHFKSKEELAVSAAGDFSSMADAAFSRAPIEEFFGVSRRLEVSFRLGSGNFVVPDVCGRRWRPLHGQYH